MYECSWEYQEAWIITPPYSGKACGIDECSKTMPAPGPGQAYAIQFEIDTYYRSLFTVIIYSDIKVIEVSPTSLSLQQS
jgi:hypothetical protein